MYEGSGLRWKSVRRPLRWLGFQSRDLLGCFPLAQHANYRGYGMWALPILGDMSGASEIEISNNYGVSRIYTTEMV